MDHLGAVVGDDARGRAADRGDGAIGVERLHVDREVAGAARRLDAEGEREVLAVDPLPTFPHAEHVGRHAEAGDAEVLRELLVLSVVGDEAGESGKSFDFAIKLVAYAE